MQITPVKTTPFYAGDDLFSFLKTHLPTVQEKDIVVVTSKIVGLAENRVVEIADDSKEFKHAIVRQEADHYIDPKKSKYNLMITIKDSLLAVNAGLDASNVAEGYVLFPKNPYESAQSIWGFLRAEYGLKKVGVIITDSKTIPLKWGITGTCLAHCGFKSLNNKIGQPDIFGRELEMTQVAVAESLAVAAVLEMGEANEMQPLCTVRDANMIQFMDAPLTPKEIEALNIEFDDDVYAPFLAAANWKKGGGGHA